MRETKTLLQGDDMTQKGQRNCTPFSHLVKYLVKICLLAIAAIKVGAQSSYTTTDVYTPKEAQPGAPAGSYALSGFDNVNLFSGHLNFRLPLVSIGGRGEAGYQMMLPIERIWHNRKFIEGDGDEVYLPEDITWDGLKPGYGPGVMGGRQVSYYTTESTTCGFPASGWATTTLTFTGPDGTEHLFVDTLTAGKYLSWSYDPCGPISGASRGTVFVTRDGTAATFISDYEIKDNPQAASVPYYAPTGHLLWKNGVRYRIEAGAVKWIRDRNGNKIEFISGTAEIRDSLN